jgi:hypothetical protein
LKHGIWELAYEECSDALQCLETLT